MTIQISEHDALSGEVVIREMSAEELATREAETAAIASAKQAAKTAADELKASAIAKLAALGLTEEEAKAILK
jgi:hypothetical protein